MEGSLFFGQAHRHPTGDVSPLDFSRISSIFYAARISWPRSLYVNTNASCRPICQLCNGGNFEKIRRLTTTHQPAPYDLMVDHSIERSLTPRLVHSAYARLTFGQQQHWSMNYDLNSTRNNPSILENTDKSSKLDLCQPLTNTLNMAVHPAASTVVASWNLVLGLTATVSNVLVFFAVRRKSSLRPPSKRLLLSLILTDVGTGTLTQPQFAAILIARTTNSPHARCFLLKSFHFTLSVFTSASLYTMASISVDRFVALFSPLRYREIVTAKRASISIIASWSLSLLHASTSLWNRTVFSFTTSAGLCVLLLFTAGIYIKIYRGLSNSQAPQRHPIQNPAQVQPHEGQASGPVFNLAKYRQSASSMVWVYGLFLLCYFPQLCVLGVTFVLSPSAVTLYIADLTTTLVFLNSSLNPFVYCFRLPEVRAEVIRLVRKITFRTSL